MTTVLMPVPVPVSAQGLNDALRVDVIDVGLGDAILISCPDQETFSLIDAGDADSRYPGAALRLRDFLAQRAPGTEKFHLFINTHPHPDHIGGFLALFDSGITAKTFLDSGANFAESDEEERLRRALETHGVEYQSRVPAQIDLCGSPAVEAKVLALTPAEEGLLGCMENLNDCSIKLRISYAGHSMLLLADATTQWEAVALKSPSLRGLLKADVLKVGHHASHVSSSASFLDAVRPEYAIVSVGAPGIGRVDTLGYPRVETLQRLSVSLKGSESRLPPVQGCRRSGEECKWVEAKRSEKLYVTSIDGTVSVRISSSGIDVSAERGRLNQPPPLPSATRLQVLEESGDRESLRPQVRDE